VTTKRARKRELQRRRLEEEEAARLAEERHKRRVNIGAWLIAGPVIAVVAVTLLGKLYGGGGSTANLSSYYPKEAIPPPGPRFPLPAAAQSAGCSLITHPAEGHAHTSGRVHYATNPPSSGDHNAIPADDGAYSKAPSIGHLVHPLEHGRIVIWFKPTAPAAVRGKLKALFDEDPNRLLLTPNETQMPYEIAASAWTGDKDHGGTIPEFGHVLGCPTMRAETIDALRAFIAAYRGKGPERIP
jgi:hypothetical protein